MKVDVAYEAKRRAKALPPLHWHRLQSGAYRAERDGRTFTLFHRSPDRRHGKLPWVLMLGGMRGQELKSFDTASDGKEWARCYNAQPPPVVVVEPGSGMPAGTFKGTLAEDRKHDAYKYEVAKHLAKMQVPDTLYRPAHVSKYIEDMDDAGVSPEITAAVIAGTVRHGHIHDVLDRKSVV